MMKNILLLLLFAPILLLAQEENMPPESTASYARHSITVGGAAVVGFWETFPSLWSYAIPLSYEYRILANKKNSLALMARGGIGSFSGLWGPEVALVGLAGKGRHHAALTTGAIFPFWEIGGGVAFNRAPLIELGYRYQRPEGGLVWRAHVGTTGLGLGAGWAF